jgi:ribosomal RNA-processing protein 1
MLLLSLTLALMSQVAYLYFTVFLSTMRREWFGIDRLRLDKFMMLVRKFVRALFLYLQAQKW